MIVICIPWFQHHPVQWHCIEVWTFPVIHRNEISVQLPSDFVIVFELGVKDVYFFEHVLIFSFSFGKLVAWMFVMGIASVHGPPLVSHSGCRDELEGSDDVAGGV